VPAKPGLREWAMPRFGVQFSGTKSVIRTVEMRRTPFWAGGALGTGLALMCPVKKVPHVNYSPPQPHQPHKRPPDHALRP